MDTLLNKAEQFKMTLGAQASPDGVQFRVWAPECKEIVVVFEEGSYPDCALQKDTQGYFSGFIRAVKPGALYRYRVDGKGLFPDPCSRYQPEGPHEPSQVMDPGEFPWSDDNWPGITLKGQVIYEVHVGTFSEEGTYDGLIRELPELKRLGITCLEIMPLAEFPGKWNWGYDGVGMFAPAHVYGHPNDLKRLIDTAHKIGLAVILDVVYNHFGPDGNYLACFSKDYFTSKYKTDWGEAINFDGKNAKEVREFFIQNACYWVSEFHFDGLRLDATQNIYDAGPEHILSLITRRSRACVAPRNIMIVGENEEQKIKLMTSLDQGGYGLDALWNDDFHHSAHVALTGKREAYYTDYLGTAQEFVAAIKRGFLYQGQFYKWQDQNRGSFVPPNTPAEKFIFYLQNHDQVANSLNGKRDHQLSQPGIHRALTALYLLSPQTPMIFMGEEFAASSPFLFFVDHNKELNPMVKEGRKEFLKQFPSCASHLDLVPTPGDSQTFYHCKLNFSERKLNQSTYQLFEDLLKIRREDPVISEQKKETIDAAVINDHAFVLRYFGADAGDRLLVVNLGGDFEYTPCPEPLLAPVENSVWKLIWTSDHPRYSGHGIVAGVSDKGWKFSGACTQLYQMQHLASSKKEKKT